MNFSKTDTGVFLGPLSLEFLLKNTQKYTTQK